MKRRVISWLLALCLVTLSLSPVTGTMAEEMELFIPTGELVLDKSNQTEEENILDDVNDSNASILEQLGKKDWTALAASVEKKGDWREDIVAVAQTQVGYAEEEDGMTIYTTWAEYKEPQEWTTLFVNWVAVQAGLTEKQFPHMDTYAAFTERMNKLHALKKVSRSSYPASGDLALIVKDDQKLVGVVVYVSNGVASVIVGDDNGAVRMDTYYVGQYGFTQYIDLNVLMERSGIEVGKGGEVPVIPEGGVAAWTNTNAVYMRSEPTTASKRVTTVKKSGTALLVTGGEMQGDGYIWYSVEYGSYTGYIRGDLLTLDMAAIPTATPEPTATPAPTATPEPTATPVPTEVPGCIRCAYEADSVALPVECCYEHLASMGAAESYRFMSSLLENDYLTFMLYVNCHNAHVYDDSMPAVICYTGCAQSIFNPVAPGAEHSEGCGWYIAAEVTEAPTAEPEVTEEPVVTPEPEATAEPTAEPTEEPAVTEAPATPADCDLCAVESEYWGVALPENGCAYAHLASLTVDEAFALMSDLDWNNYSAYRMYLDCHNDHVLAGAAPVICYGDVCSAGAYTQPGTAHTTECPWYVNGDLTLEERVVNIVVNQPVSSDGVKHGQEVTFTFEVFGAQAYQWFQVEMVEETVGGETTQKAVTTMLVGETGTTLTVVASEETAGRSYYCEATLVPGDYTSIVTSKLVTMDVEAVIEAQAIIGEEVNFTYNYEGDATYQWYVLAPEATEYVAVEGETDARIALTAELAMSGAKYYCEATLTDGTVVTSSCYAYEIPVYESYDVDSCTTHDLCKYVSELANMTRSERYAIMTGAWNVAVGDTTLAELVRQHWQSDNAETDHNYIYATLLCTCDTLKDTSASHDTDCPWDSSKTPAKTEREKADPCDNYKGLLPDGVLCAYEFLSAMNPVEQYNYLYALWLEAEEYITQDYTNFISAYTDHSYESAGALADIICNCHYLNPIYPEYAPGTNHETTCPWYMTAEALDALNRQNATDYTYGTENSSVQVQVENNPFSESYNLNITTVEASQVITDAIAAIQPALNAVLAVYDISFTAADDGAELQPATPVTLTFVAPTTESDVGRSLFVYHISDDGSAELVDVIPVTAANQTIQVSAGSFSYYVVATADVDTSTICGYYSARYGVALPEGFTCFYDYLASLGNGVARYNFLKKWYDVYEDQSTEVGSAEYYTYEVYIYAHNDHVSEGETALLCTCEAFGSGIPLTNVEAPGASHPDDCPWSLSVMKDERLANDAEFAAWAALETTTEAMIARALTVATLDHVVFEQNADGVTYTAYVVRYADPVGTVDADGFLTYTSSGRIIGWVDFKNRLFYPIYDLPDGVTAPSAQ